MKLNGPGKVDIRTKLPDEVCMAIFWPPPGFRARTLDLWVLKRGNLNFCIHTTSLPDPSAVKKDFRASACILKRTRRRKDGSFLVQFNVLENLGLKIEKPTFSEYPSSRIHRRVVQDLESWWGLWPPSTFGLALTIGLVATGNQRSEPIK